MDNNNSFNNFKKVNFGESFEAPKTEVKTQETVSETSQKDTKNNKTFVSDKNKIRITIYTLLAIFLFVLAFNQNILNTYFLYNANKAYAAGNYEKAFKNFKEAFSTSIDNSSYVEKYYSAMEKMEFYPIVQKEMIKLKHNYKNQTINNKINLLFEKKQQEILSKAGQTYIDHTPTNTNIVHLNSAYPIIINIEKSDVPDFYISQIRDAFESWSKALDGELVFKFTNDKEADIEVVFVDSISGATEQYGKKIQILGATEPSYSGNKLIKTKIKFKKTDIDDTQFTENQIYNLSLHEIGHALGISGHSYNPTDVMYPTNNDTTWINETETLLISKKYLTNVDINTIKLLYKIIPNITNKIYSEDYVKGLYYPEIILGNTEKMAAKKLKESQSYITMVSGNYISYMNLGEGYFATKNYEEAKKAFLSAIKLARENNEFHNAYFNLAVVSFESGNYKDAIEFATIANSYSDEKKGNEVIGFSYMKLKKYDKAQEQFEQLVQMYPDNIVFSATLTDIYFSTYKIPKAFNEMKRIKSINPKALSDDAYSHYKIFGAFL